MSEVHRLKNSSPSRRRYNRIRAEKWRQKLAEKKELAKCANTQVTRPPVTLQWVKGPTISLNPEPVPQQKKHPEPLQAKAEPEKIYRKIEHSMKLARLEESATLTLALRYLVRQLHPRGKQITFPIPEAVDKIQLRCSNLPTNVNDLRTLTHEVFHRRGEKLDFEELYRDFVMSHGRIASDFSKPWPQCYAHIRHP